MKKKLDRVYALFFPSSGYTYFFDSIEELHKYHEVHKTGEIVQYERVKEWSTRSEEDEED